MTFLGRAARLLVSLASLLAISSCYTSVVYLLPDGYTGPVVVVFGDPAGIEPERENGDVVYEVPSNGVLRVRATPLPDGLYRIRYFYVRADASRNEIPDRAASDQIQAFLYRVGVTTPSADAEASSWAAFIVGIPDERDDWAAVQETARWEAVRAVNRP